MQKNIQNNNSQIICPNCKFLFSAKGETVKCPNCKIVLEKKVKMKETSEIPLIFAIVEKDIRGYFLAIIILSLISIFIFILSIGNASTISRYRDDIQIRIYDVYPIYGFAMFISFLAFLITFTLTYGTELRKGTIRSIALYPIGMNGITIAKLISGITIATIFSGILYFSVYLPYAIYKVYPISLIFGSFFIATSMSILIVLTGAFLSHIFTYFTNTTKLSVSRMISILLVLSFALTETFSRWVGEMIIFSRASMMNATGEQIERMLRDLDKTIDFTSDFSPYHSGGRIIANLLNIPTGNIDVHFIIPIAIVSIIFGFILGKKIYLDVFLRD